MSTDYTALNLKWSDLKQAAPTLGLTVEHNDDGDRYLKDAEGNMLFVYGPEDGQEEEFCLTRYMRCGNPRDMINKIEAYFGVRVISSEQEEQEALAKELANFLLRHVDFRRKAATVGELREILKDLPADLPVSSDSPGGLPGVTVRYVAGGEFMPIVIFGAVKSNPTKPNQQGETQ